LLISLLNNCIRWNSHHFKYCKFINDSNCMFAYCNEKRKYHKQK